MIGRRKKEALVEKSTKVADKVIELRAWRGARVIHGIASVVEGPTVRFPDVYEEMKELYERADQEDEQDPKRQNQLLRQETHRKKAQVVRRHQEN